MRISSAVETLIATHSFRKQKKIPPKVIMDHDGGTTPLVDRESLDTRLASHERALAALNAEQAQLIKQLETLKAERQVLQAVARKVATSRRLSDGTQQA